MKNKILNVFFIILFVNSLYSQSIRNIDSINSIPFEVKLEKAINLEDIYLKNAKNSRTINYLIGEAESYSNLSLIYYILGKYDKDVLYSLKSITLFEKINAKEKLAIQFGELGYRMKKRNLPQAINYIQKGKKIAEQNNLIKPLLSLYNNYGVLKEMQVQNDSALYFYNKGLVLKEKINDSTGIPYSLNNIAGIYMIRKQFAAAEKLYSRALKIRLARNDNYGITENLSYFGDLYLAKKEYQQSIFYFQKSLEKARQFNFADLIQYSHKKLSENYELLNNSSEALKKYKEYTQLKDSLLNQETNSKIAELDIKFESTQKEKQLLEKQVEIENERNKLVGVAFLALFVAIIGFLIYRQQKQKNEQQFQENKLNAAIAQIENQNKLQEQRLEISRDLHDNIGSQLTFIISSVDNVKYAFDINNTKLHNKLTNISNFAKDTILELRDTIWAMNSNEITFEDLEIRINNFIEKAKEAKDQISFSFAIEEGLKTNKLTSVEGMNIYRTIQEAINNSLKYANADIISISIKQQESKINITVKDNGQGFDFVTIEKGNGLKNMQKRIENIGGKFVLLSGADGTKIEVII